MPDRRLLTLGLFGVVSAAAFESLAVATIMPAAVAEIGGLAFYGWVFSSFMLAEIVGICAAGHLADARGLALPFATGALAFGAGLLAAGLAPSMLTLIGARVVQGLGAGAVSALAYTAVAPWVAMPSWALAGLGIGVAYSTVSLVVLEEAPRGEEGAASAALQLAFVLGTAVGTGATGAVVARWLESGQPLAAAIAFAFAVAVALASLALAVVARVPGRT